MSDTVADVAYEARNLAIAAAQRIEGHEDLCAERYGNINSSIREIKSILKWAGTTGFGIIIALIGFLAVQIYNTNEATKTALATRLEVVSQQNADLRRAEKSQPAAAPLP